VFVAYAFRYGFQTNLNAVHLTNVKAGMMMMMMAAAVA
jgi:hypothetical protein